MGRWLGGCWVRARMTKQITLGPFVLEHRVDEGGMGVVWRGRHERQGVPVAVKVLLSQKARDHKLYAAFRREVQAVARLNHAKIVTLFDYGTLPKEAEVASGGELVAGSPYLVMEFASGGSFKHFQPRTWEEAKGALLELLDALGHAHARGLIHRDLKPANVLICTEEDVRPGLKLSDFGIAHASERNRPTMRETQTASEFENPSGTPLYMAPEQFTGQWRDYGPWTDTYALGVMAYEFITGQPPFTSTSFMMLAFDHMEREVPEVETRFPVPPDVWGWIKHMMAKKRGQRFQRASDAAWALSNLGDAPAEVSSARMPKLALTSQELPATVHPAPPRTPPRITSIGMAPNLSSESIPVDISVDVSIDVSLDFDSPSVFSFPNPSPVTSADEDAEETEDVTSTLHDHATSSHPKLEVGQIGARETLDAVRALEAVAVASTDEAEQQSPVHPCISAKVQKVSSFAPLPQSWRTLRDDEPPVLMGAGLGLFSLRDAPLVDRNPERDVLWSALLRALSTEKPQLVMLSGPAGYGKSHLARWLCERAHEVGAADVLKATHDPNAGPTHGLARMVANHYQCVGMPFAAAHERIRAQLKLQDVTEPYEWNALSELIADRGLDAKHESQQLVRFNNPTERYALLRRMIGRVAEQRATILWLDDAHWSADTLAFALYMMKAVQTGRLPLLVLLTVNQESVGEIEREHLSALAQLERAERCEIGPLPDHDVGVLLERFLGLSRELAQEVAQRVQGNPLLATKLIGDWIQQGALRDQGAGFVLFNRSLLKMPSDLKLVWRDQLTHALQGQPQGTQIALELAAILGQEVTWRELMPACINAGIFLQEATLEPLIRDGLILATADGWAFAHSMLRDSLLVSAQEQNRAQRLHRACANMLAKLYPQDHDSHGVQARRARHLLAAGALQEALAPLLQAARDGVSRSEYGKANQLMDEREQTLRALGIAEGVGPWIDSWLLRAEIAREQNQSDAAKQFAQRVLEVKPEALDHLQAQHAEALLILAHVARQKGDRAQAFQLTDQARAEFEAQSQGRGVARCLLLQAIIHRERGESDNANTFYQHAREFFEALQDAEGQGKCLLGQGHVFRQRKDYDQAKQCYKHAQNIFQAIGNQSELASAINGLAEVAKYKSDYSNAEAGYRRAASIFEAIDSQQSAILQLNLGFLILKRRDYVQARQVFERVLSVPRLKPVQAIAHVCMLPCVAYASDYVIWDHHHAQAVQLLSETQTIDPDLADLAQQSGHLLLQSGEVGRAKQSFVVALKQWEALKLGESEQAMVVRRLLTAL